MPKMKSNRSAMKRFHITATGRIKRQRAFVRHLLTKKARKRKRNLRQAAFVSPSDAGRIKRLLLL
jgi:large subunit ribosomal protein L35